jgi:hypothetical protein
MSSSRIVDASVTLLKLSDRNYRRKSALLSGGGSAEGAKRMSANGRQLTAEITKFVEAAWFDLPIAAAQQFIGRANEDALRTAGWKAYDAFVGLANEVTNEIYASPITAQVTNRAMEASLRWQEIGNALAGAFFGNLWPSIGLATANQINNLRAEIAGVRRELTQVLETAKGYESNTDTHHHAPAEGLMLVRGRKIASTKREDDKDAAA